MLWAVYRVFVQQLVQWTKPGLGHLRLRVQLEETNTEPSRNTNIYLNCTYAAQSTVVICFKLYWFSFFSLQPPLRILQYLAGLAVHLAFNPGQLTHCWTIIKSLWEEEPLVFCFYWHRIGTSPSPHARGDFEADATRTHWFPLNKNIEYLCRASGFLSHWGMVNSLAVPCSMSLQGYTVRRGRQNRCVMRSYILLFPLDSFIFTKD